MRVPERGIILSPGTSVPGAGIRDVLAAGAAAWTALRIVEGKLAPFLRSRLTAQ